MSAKKPIGIVLNYFKLKIIGPLEKKYYQI